MTTAQPLTMELPRLDLNELIAELSSKIVHLPDRRGAERASLGRRVNQRFQVKDLQATAQRIGHNDTVACHVEDVSSGGACLNSTTDFQPGEVVNLHIKGADGRSIPVRGEVCYRKSGAESHSYGIRFLKTLPILLALYAPLSMMTASDVEAGWGTTEITAAQQQQIGAGDYEGTLEFGGLERTYRLHVPKSYDANNPAPLVMLFHGNKESGKSIQKYAGLDKLSDKLEQGFIVVYPDAVDEEWSIDAEQADIDRDIDDVGFVLELQKQLGQMLSIDESRIYASGMSRGGLFAMKLGCELSESIAAVAAVASTMRDKSYHTDCAPTAPVSTAIIFGRDDPIMPYAGGDVRVKSNKLLGMKLLGNAVSIDETVNFWADNNGCKTSQSEWLKDTKDDGTEVAKVAYNDCEDGRNVVHYDIVGGGHTWPGAKGFGNKWLLGNTSKDVNTAEIMWEFFAEQSTKS